MGIILMACNPCSGCNQVVANYLANLERDNTLCKLEDIQLHTDRMPIFLPVSQESSSELVQET